MSNKAKFQVAIAAVDQFSAPLKAAHASFDALTRDVKSQSAELKKLNASAASLRSYANLKRELTDTSVQMHVVKQRAEKLNVSARELGLQTKGYEAAVTASAHKLERLESQMRATERPAKSLKAEIKETRKELGLNTARLSAHNAQLKKSQTEAEKARHDVQQLNQYYDAQREKLHQLKVKLSESGIQAHRFGEAQRQIKQDIHAANAALDRQKAKLNAVRTASAKIKANKAARAELGGQALDLAIKGAALAVPVKFAIDFESAFADVKKAVNDASPEELTVMKQRIITEAPKLGVDQEGLAAIIAEGGRNGIKKENLFQFAESAAKMSVAFDMSADEAGAAMMKWRTTMNLTQDQAVHLADAVNYVGDHMATTAKDITEVLVRQGAVITNAGLDEVGGAALSAAVLSGSASTEIAATATKNLLLNLTAGDSASKSQKDAMMTLGFDPADLARDMQHNAPETVEQVLRAIKSQDVDVQTALMKDLFGSESIGSIAPLLKNLDNFRKAFQLVEKETNFSGSMQTEFEIQSATAKRKISAFTASLTGLVTVLGNGMLPVVGAVLDVVTPAISWLTDVAQQAPGVTAALMAIPAALIAIKGAALAFKFGKLLVGQGKNHADLFKAKLGIGLDGTASSAKRATSRLFRLSQAIDRLGADGNRRGFQRQGASFKERRQSRKLKGRSSRFRRGGKLGRLLSLGSLVTDFLPDAPVRAVAPVAKNQWAKRAALIGGGAGLSLMSDSASASELAAEGADVADIVGGVAEALPLKGVGAKLAGATGKLMRPVGMVMDAVSLVSAVKSGDAQEIGGSAGDIAGGLGGGALGAAIGTAILPGIGTLIGGALGSLAGGAAGDWLGRQFGALFAKDKSEPTPKLIAEEAKPEATGILTPPVTKLPDPASGGPAVKHYTAEKVAEAQTHKQTLSLEGHQSGSVLPEPVHVLPSPEKLANSLSRKYEDNRQTTINITVPPSSGNKMQDDDMINRLVEKLKQALMSDGMMNDHLAVHMDGSLSDRSQL